MKILKQNKNLKFKIHNSLFRQRRARQVESDLNRIYLNKNSNIQIVVLFYMFYMFIVLYKQCNCRSAINCPLNGKWCRNSIVCKASLKTGQTDKLYYGSCKTSFKLPYNNHNQSFKDNRKINSTELSKSVWKFKQSGQSPEIR